MNNQVTFDITREQYREYENHFRGTSKYVTEAFGRTWYLTEIGWSGVTGFYATFTLARDLCRTNY